MMNEAIQRHSHSSSGLPYTLTPGALLLENHRIRASVLGLFREPPLRPAAGAWDISPRRWTRLLHWLDTSGLALYFLKRVTELGIEQALPLEILTRLQTNLRDNVRRLDAMVQEAASIRSGFERAGLVYAVSKGFSLWPDSVPQMELRSQLDLDFLIAEADATQARHQLEQRGYLLCAISGRTWEFKTPATRAISLADLYKPAPQFCVELHFEPSRGPHLLQRRQKHMHAGVSMPVLSAADIFIGQARHVFKHLSRDAMRTSHLVEFYRHTRARHADVAFWEIVAGRVQDDPDTQLALGAALLLVAQEFATPLKELTALRSISAVPPGVRLWIERYGSRATYDDFPGSKLYLLLQGEIEKHGAAGARSVRASLLPLQLPPAIAVRPQGEMAAASLRRYWKQIWYLGFRARFHLVAGLEYAFERPAWKRSLEREYNAATGVNPAERMSRCRTQQSNDIPLTGM